eukprot:267364-Rhodomonas_salina.3
MSAREDMARIPANSAKIRHNVNIQKVEHLGFCKFVHRGSPVWVRGAIWTCMRRKKSIHRWDATIP